MKGIFENVIKVYKIKHTANLRHVVFVFLDKVGGGFSKCRALGRGHRSHLFDRLLDGGGGDIVKGNQMLKIFVGNAENAGGDDGVLRHHIFENFRGEAISRCFLRGISRAYEHRCLVLFL